MKRARIIVAVLSVVLWVAFGIAMYMRYDYRYWVDFPTEESELAQVFVDAGNPLTREEVESFKEWVPSMNARAEWWLKSPGVVEWLFVSASGMTLVLVVVVLPPVLRAGYRVGCGVSVDTYRQLIRPTMVGSIRSWFAFKGAIKRFLRGLVAEAKRGPDQTD